MPSDKILKIIKDTHYKTGGHCGVYLASFKMDIQVLKNELNNLYKKGLITKRKGINGVLIYYKSDKIKDNG